MLNKQIHSQTKHATHNTHTHTLTHTIERKLAGGMFASNDDGASGDLLGAGLLGARGDTNSCSSMCSSYDDIVLHNKNKNTTY